MNPEIGAGCASLLPAAAVVWLFVRLRNAESRTERTGYAAAACGVGGFIPALWAPVFKSPGEAPLLVAAAVITLLLALAAAVLAVRALRARRHDRQGSPLLPILGLACGVANLLCGSCGTTAEMVTPPPAARNENRAPSGRGRAAGGPLAGEPAGWYAQPSD